MINYREAESLVTLREQLNRRFPKRDKTSDGWIGDSSHATRSSDHNPWVIDGKTGIVTAQDIDADLNDPAYSMTLLVANICRSRDRRAKYVIWQGRITVHGSNLQEWTAYHGPNKHNHHCHISVVPIKALYDDTRPWIID